MPKNGQTPIQFCSFHMLAKVMLKILLARLQKYVNWELPDGFRKGRRIRDQVANIHWIIEIAREFHKNIYFCFIVYTKAFDCVDHHWPNIPGSYVILFFTELDFTFTTRIIHKWASFPLWPSCFILSIAIHNCLPLFPSSMLDTFWSLGLIFWCHIFLPFHTAHT